MALTGRNKEQHDRAEREPKAAIEWLGRFVQPGQPRPATKDKLRALAMRELGVSKQSFDFAWIWVIEDTGRSDWYEPLRARKSPTRRQ